VRRGAKGDKHDSSVTVPDGRVFEHCLLFAPFTLRFFVVATYNFTSLLLLSSNIHKLHPFPAIPSSRLLESLHGRDFLPWYIVARARSLLPKHRRSALNARPLFQHLHPPLGTILAPVTWHPLQLPPRSNTSTTLSSQRKTLISNTTSMITSLSVLKKSSILSPSLILTGDWLTDQQLRRRRPMVLQSQDQALRPVSRQPAQDHPRRRRWHSQPPWCSDRP